ncbi:FG-GAP repeat domain-containing protein [Plantactinospora sonchi]|uniref:VCBS repeat-containing protein n=1 Tax=Plantactinospora sonchi TaxID=1544735 RepID=A0ABU7RVC0_9ACTN
MWKRRLAVLVSGVLIGSLAMAAPPAQAGIEGDPIWGDLNGDRRLDRVELGSSSDQQRCAVRVQWSGPGAVEEHVYTPPGATLPVSHCPGMGAAVDLAGDGRAELVLGSFHGSPIGADGSILVLRDFVPEVLTTANIQLNEIGTADFNGDGLTDVFWWSNQGEGFGTRVPGHAQGDQGQGQRRGEPRRGADHRRPAPVRLPQHPRSALRGGLPAHRDAQTAGHLRLPAGSGRAG